MEHLTLYGDMSVGATAEEIKEFEAEIINDFKIPQNELLALLSNLDLTVLNKNFPHIITFLDYYKFDKMSELKEKWLFDMYDKNTCMSPQVEQITNQILLDYLKSESRVVFYESRVVFFKS